MANKKPILTNNQIGNTIMDGIHNRQNMKQQSKRVKFDAKKLFRVMDEQNAINRYKWYNLPCDLTSQELERMLYYKYQVIFFYLPETEKFYFSPFTLDGTLDIYGRYNTVKPVPMTSGMEDDVNNKDKMTPLAQFFAEKKLDVKYGVKLPEELTYEDLTNSAVILRDYTNQLSVNAQSRQVINDPLLGLESDTLAYLRTHMMVSSGVKGVKVSNDDEAGDVLEGANSMDEAALTSTPWVPIIGGINFQDITSSTSGNNQDYLLALQSLDNLRLSTYGLDNGGLFEKKAQKTVAEANMNMSNISVPLLDGLKQRQMFATIANSIWGTSMWCDIEEVAAEQDRDYDGDFYNSDEEETGVELEGDTENESDL
jgi:hypothetical protein